MRKGTFRIAATPRSCTRKANIPAKILFATSNSMSAISLSDSVDWRTTYITRASIPRAKALTKTMAILPKNTAVAAILTGSTI